MNEPKKVILFDFDGVLANTLEPAYMIHKIINPHFSWEQFEKLSDGNFHEEYEKLSGHIHPENYLDDYSKELAGLTLEEKLATLVNHLSQAYTLYVVSSTKSLYIKDFLRKEEVLEKFVGILGADIHTSKVHKIKSILDNEMINPNQCVYITDTIGDIKEARVCDVSCIGVTWGLNKKEKLEKENPFAVVDTPEELDMAITKFFSIL
jgi:phosphoglycolate phosphatase-like HAD superfamily hydrolase